MDQEFLLLSKEEIGKIGETYISNWLTKKQIANVALRLSFTGIAKDIDLMESIFSMLGAYGKLPSVLERKVGLMATVIHSAMRMENAPRTGGESTQKMPPHKAVADPKELSRLRR